MLTQDTIAGLAPDQSSLKAASKLTKASKWPELAFDATGSLVWGACQGSGANPYRVVFDKADLGYKCTCPSRKFPCKHALALMWMYADGPDAFSSGTVPEWVSDWLGRRRNTGQKPEIDTQGKSLAAAQLADAPKGKDPKAEARAKAAAEKRAAQTEVAIRSALDELETWILDQLRTGLAGLMNDLTPRCRAIAARMVDGKCAALGSRLDQLPADLMELPPHRRLDALLRELSRLVVLARAYRADPKGPGHRQAIATAENRDTLLESPDAVRVTSRWEVVGEQISTRRDGNVAQATWLMNLGKGPAWGLLLDFFPAATGTRTSAFAPGAQFQAELVFYPAASPLRAILLDRQNVEAAEPWPSATTDPLTEAASRVARTPWAAQTPILLPAGQLVASRAGEAWWRGASGLALPLRGDLPDLATGMTLSQMVAIWDGDTIAPLAAHSPDWGRVTFDA